MIEREPVHRTTRQVIADARARQEAFAEAERLLAEATGTAHDVDGTVEVTVSARGKLLNLWLAPAAVNWGPDRLGALIVEVAQVAMREATQNGYNRVALRLGEDMTYAIEQLSGLTAPARTDQGAGLTAAEFQRRRDERLRATERRTRHVPATEAAADDELDSFDPSTLRSDR